MSMGAKGVEIMQMFVIDVSPLTVQKKSGNNPNIILSPYSLKFDG